LPTNIGTIGDSLQEELTRFTDSKSGPAIWDSFQVRRYPIEYDAVPAKYYILGTQCQAIHNPVPLDFPTLEVTQGSSASINLVSSNDDLFTKCQYLPTFIKGIYATDYTTPMSTAYPWLSLSGFTVTADLTGSPSGLDAMLILPVEICYDEFTDRCSYSSLIVMVYPTAFVDAFVGSVSPSATCEV